MVVPLNRQLLLLLVIWHMNLLDSFQVSEKVDLLVRVLNHGLKVQLVRDMDGHSGPTLPQVIDMISLLDHMEVTIIKSHPMLTTTSSLWVNYSPVMVDSLRKEEGHQVRGKNSRRKQTYQMQLLTSGRRGSVLV